MNRLAALTRRLDVRLAFVLALALLPLGLVASLQAYSLSEEAHARAEAALLGATRRAASDELVAIKRGTGIAEALAAMLAVPGAVTPEECNLILAELAEAETLFSFIAHYDRAGNFICSSKGPLPDQPFPEAIRGILDAESRVRSVLPEAPISETSVFFVQQPVRDPGGEITGFVSVSIPDQVLAGALPSVAGIAPINVIVFEADGQILSSILRDEALAASLPEGTALEDIANSADRAFVKRSVDGKRRAYAVTALDSGEIFALTVWPLAAFPGPVSGTAATPIVLPLLMWLASLLIAVIASERLVVRHVRQLNEAMRTFALSRRIERPRALSAAPEQLRQLGEAFEQMAETIVADEAEREENLREKEVLLREVHHRVKNNLQLIASIMNLKYRRARSAEARALIARLQSRVMTLANVHKLLYQSESLAQVRADEVIGGILRQLNRLADDPDRRFALRQHLDPLVLDPDQSVPLALFVTEALTNALKHASSDGEKAPEISVILEREPTGAVRVEIANSYAPGDDPEAATFDGGLGSQLLPAFADQLGGELERSLEEGTFRVVLRFSPEKGAAPPQDQAAQRSREEAGEGA